MRALAAMDEGLRERRDWPVERELEEAEARIGDALQAEGAAVEAHGEAPPFSQAELAQVSGEPHLRRHFENAAGTAAQCRDRMFDTFAGQRQLLRGSLGTIAGKVLVVSTNPVSLGLVHGLRSERSGTWCGRR